jgi:hypothetical protein
MNKKSLINTNPYLHLNAELGQQIARNVASSTAVETGQTVAVIMERINQLRARKPQVLQQKHVS